MRRYRIIPLWHTGQTGGCPLERRPPNPREREARERREGVYLRSSHARHQSRERLLQRHHHASQVSAPTSRSGGGAQSPPTIYTWTAGAYGRPWPPGPSSCAESASVSTAFKCASPRPLGRRWTAPSLVIGRISSARRRIASSSGA